MVEILFLLLPLAFFSGWKVARNQFKKNQKKQRELSGHFVKGVNFLLNEEPDKALEVFLNYPDIDEYTVETYQLLGNLFRNRGEVDRALRVHQNLIARTNLSNQQKNKAMYSLGQDFFSAGMLDRAESVFKELLNNPGSNKHFSKASVCTSLRVIYEQTQEWDKAIDAMVCFKKLKTKEDDHLADHKGLVAHYYCELADEALQKGNLHEVEQLLKNARHSHKQSARILSLQGDVAFHQKHYPQALKKYLLAVKQDNRLLSMLFDKIELSAQESGDFDSLLTKLINLYKKTRDHSAFEKVLIIAKKHQIKSSILDSLIISELSSKKLNIESIYNASKYIDADIGAVNSEEGISLLNHSLASYLHGVSAFRCSHCGYKMHNFLWRCPACHHWDSVEHA